MKYLALIYTDEAAWEALSEDERKNIYDRYAAFSREASDKIVSGAETAGTRSATTVRVRDGETRVTDGPFEALAEPLGGFYVFASRAAFEHYVTSELFATLMPPDSVRDVTATDFSVAAVPTALRRRGSSRRRVSSAPARARSARRAPSARAPRR